MNIDTQTATEKKNPVFGKDVYQGSKSTLCMGCGHDSITSHIISAYHQLGIDPRSVAKISGIGCSSKTPAYFMKTAHGFNTIHGRLAPIATGAYLADHQMKLIGISGDGDTASIGIGGFMHMIRRNLPIVYIVENNGVYGLTKGQFSATADENSISKGGEANMWSTIDICELALTLGCGFVARSFSGDAKQLVPLIMAAVRHPGTSVIDIISPCVTFANHEGSTRSYDHVRSTNKQLQALGFISPQQEITVDFAEGERQEVELFDGSKLMLKKLHRHDHDFSNRFSAIELIEAARKDHELVTGLFYMDTKQKGLGERIKLPPTKSLRFLGEQETRLSEADFDRYVSKFA